MSIKISKHIGITDCGRGCVLKTTLTDDCIKENAQALTSEHFTHESTNWGGADDVSRVMELSHLLPTGETVKVNPIRIHGVDYDHGHEYNWQITVTGLLLCQVDEEAERSEELNKSIDIIESQLWFLKKDFQSRIENIEKELAKIKGE